MSNFKFDEKTYFCVSLAMRHVNKYGAYEIKNHFDLESHS